MKRVRQAVQTLANRFGYRIEKLREPKSRARVDVLRLMLEHTTRSQPDPVIVQIGANDGATADPVGHLIRENGWRALLVEPQPHMFTQLQEVYRNSEHVLLENAALAATDGSATMYGVRDPGGPLSQWTQQLASFDRELVEALLRDQVASLPVPEGFDVESLVVPMEVPALTFETLLERHGVDRVDALVVDTMGFDAEVLRLFPFDLVGAPAVISFEATFLPFEEREACLDSLSARGYGFCHSGMDTLAVREPILDD